MLLPLLCPTVSGGGCSHGAADASRSGYPEEDRERYGRGNDRGASLLRTPRRCGLRGTSIGVVGRGLGRFYSFGRNASLSGSVRRRGRWRGLQWDRGRASGPVRPRTRARAMRLRARLLLVLRGRRSGPWEGCEDLWAGLREMQQGRWIFLESMVGGAKLAPATPVGPTMLAADYELGDGPARSRLAPGMKEVKGSLSLSRASPRGRTLLPSTAAAPCATEWGTPT
jgi:hypothetical protein